MGRFVQAMQYMAISSFLFATLVIIFNAFVLDHLYRSPLTTRPSSSAETYNRTRLLTVNMFMRPPGIRSHSSDYKDERLEYFIDHVLPNYDVITLQEMFSFMTTRRQRLIRAAEELGFHYWVTSPAPPLWGLSIDGGLAILSRYPIVDMDSIRYDRGEYSDWLAAKGALYAKIALNPKTHIHIFTTHTQASYGKVTPIDAPSVQIRFRQFADLHRFMRAKTADRLPGEPVIVQGDFNVDARVHEPDQEEDLKEARSTPEYLEMLNIFRGKTPEETSFLLSESKSDSEPEPEPEVPIDHLPFRDLVYQQWRYHPVTFADVKELPDGRRIARDRILTDDQLHGSCQRLDYVFWADPLAYPVAESHSEAKYTVRPVNATVAPLFTRKNDPNAAFTQLSDHYGVSTELEIIDLNELA